MTRQMTINVIQRNDEDTGFELLEVIERKGTEVREAEQRGTRGRPAGRYRVSYGGRRFVTFRLPECYGDCAGQCIWVRPWQLR